MRIAYIVSSHGFGHATRASAVMAALRAARPSLHLDIVTTTPRWVFEDSLGERVAYHSVETDVGMVQRSSLHEDLAASVDTIRGFVDTLDDRAEALATTLHRLGSQLVVADIAPLGLAAAKRAGIPSVLVESFTWTWIYRHYRTGTAFDHDLQHLADRLAHHFASADHHLQTEPLCERARSATHVPPIARRPKSERNVVRARLGVPDSHPMILVTMGGIPWDFSRLDDNDSGSSARPWLIIPGGTDTGHQVRGRYVLFPHHSDFYHPDLIHAADAVLGKLGYSTVAEVWRAGVPFGYIPRPDFPESPKLETWVRNHLSHRRIDPTLLDDDSWVGAAEELIGLPRQPPPDRDGATEAAATILNWLDQHR